MPYTPVTVALLKKLRREQGRPLHANAADIGIHRDREPILPCWCHTDAACPVDHSEPDPMRID